MESEIQKHLSGKNKKEVSKASKLTQTMVAMFLVAALVFTSCKKKTEEAQPENPAQTDTEQATATDNNLAENTAADIESMGSQVAENNTLSTFRTSGVAYAEGLAASPCANVTISGQIITVDFGTTGCVGLDGRVRTGKLIYNFSASSPATAIRYRNPGFSMSVSSQNYVVDGYQVNITNKIVTNTTPNTISPNINPGVNLTWSIAANISIVKPNNAGTITWVCSRTKELTNTSDTNCYKGQSRAIVWTVAKVKLNGSATGVNAKGENYTAVATNLERNFNCTPDALHPHRHPFTGGSISYTPGSRPTRTIDYGNGGCDLNATITINGVSYPITLP